MFCPFVPYELSQSPLRLPPLVRFYRDFCKLMIINKLSICTILCPFFTIFFICFINNTIKPYVIGSVNRLLIASQVRDKDELRLAEANTLIGQWRLEKWLPFSLDNKFHYGGDHDFLILMITSNRRHRKIDAFEPYYLTQTSVALVNTLMSAKPGSYNFIGTVNFLLCSVGHVNDTNGDVFNAELKRLRRVFGPDAFIMPSNALDGPCKSALDMVSCISSGLRRHFASKFVVLLEDDFLVTENFMPALNIYASRTGGSLLRLYMPSQATDYHPSVRMYMLILYLIATLPSLIALCLIFSRIGRRGIRYLAATIIVTVMFLMLKAWTKPVSLVIFPSTDLQSVATGAAVVLPIELAENLGRTDLQSVCASSNSAQSKADLVARAATQLKHGALDVLPPAVIHIGMYSQNRGSLHDPLLFPH